MLGESHKTAEVVINLWAYSDEDGNIQRLAGKSYALHGTDTEKLNILRCLARSDFLTAKWIPVAKNFTLVGPNGESMQGITSTAVLRTPNGHADLFAELIEHLAKTVPAQLVVCPTNGYRQIHPKLPDEPLAITTVVIEQQNGQLVPVLNG
nr:hypothetical protein [uncultured Deefgea sp.]